MYVGFTPFVYLKLNKMYIYTRETCWNTYDHGTFQFEIAFSASLMWTNKHYIRLSPWDFTRQGDGVSWDPYVSEFLCYFDLDNNIFSAKSEYCNQNGSVLTIWPPEETNLLAGNRMLINVDWRGQIDRGVSTGLFPKRRHIMVTPVQGAAVALPAAVVNEVAPLEWQHRGCYFSNQDYHDTDWNSENIHSFWAVDHYWNEWNQQMTWNGRDHRL